MTISRSVVDAVRCMNPPGRFLEKDPASGKWFDIGDRKAIEKTSQALRDGAASLRKELNQELSDPEFLSVVFDDDDATNRTPSPIVTLSTVSSSSPSSVSSSQRKKKIPIKTHRRVKSSPLVGKTSSIPTVTSSSSSSANLRKSRHLVDIPMSPTEPSYSLLVNRKPPPSPCLSHPKISPPLLPTFQRNVDTCHRRIQSHGSDAIFMRPPISPSHNSNLYQIPVRSSSFEQNDPYERRRPPQSILPSIPLASPKPYPTQQPPTSPSTNLPSMTYPRLSQSYHATAMPHWSPRGDIYHSPRMQTSQYHPIPEHTVRYPVSPRHQDRHQQYQHPYNYSYGPSNTLSVPSLVSDTIRPQLPHLAMAPPRFRFPTSPMQVRSYVNNVTPDFIPPESSLRSQNSPNQGKYSSNVNENDRLLSNHEGIKEEQLHDSVSKVSSISPLAVVDITNRAISVEPNNEVRGFYEKEYPSDEEIDPANDSFSPLPYDEGDMTSFLEFSDALFPLPMTTDNQSEFEI
jgi:hypothetical protein